LSGESLLWREFVLLGNLGLGVLMVWLRWLESDGLSASVLAPA
jgi:hypothetical protein